MGIYIDSSAHRLGKIAVNHFNRLYGVTDGLWHLNETGTRTLLMTLYGNPESIESVLALCLHYLATQASVNLMIAV